jgi:hypothetical protein
LFFTCGFEGFAVFKKAFTLASSNPYYPPPTTKVLNIKFSFAKLNKQTSVCGDNAMTFYFFLSESFFCLSKGQT